MDGTELPVSFMRDPPKKFPTPTPKVVMARPVTFWFALRVTVRNANSRPMSSAPARQAMNGIRIAIIGTTWPPQLCS